MSRATAARGRSAAVAVRATGIDTVQVHFFHSLSLSFLPLPKSESRHLREFSSARGPRGVARRVPRYRFGRQAAWPGRQHCLLLLNPLPPGASLSLSLPLSRHPTSFTLLLYIVSGPIGAGRRPGAAALAIPRRAWAAWAGPDRTAWPTSRRRGRPSSPWPLAGSPLAPRMPATPPKLHPRPIGLSIAASTESKI